MTESAPLPKPPADLHWGIVYLREDIQDLRTEIRGLHTRIDGLRSEMVVQNDQVTGQLDRQRRELTTQIDGLRGEMVNRHYWTIATMVTLAGVMAAVVKL